MRISSFGHAAMLVDTGTERILVDPWLTPRLDRMWERWPPPAEDPFRLLDELPDAIDAIIFTHHHFDHHHFPSLAALRFNGDADFDETLSARAAVRCYYPVGEGVPRFTSSGLGHQTIGWTLRRLGYHTAHPVTPGELIRIGSTVVRTFPSRVPFPEMSLLVTSPDGSAMLCGDALLHPSTVEYFRSAEHTRVDVAFVPAHSASPAGVLTERRQVTQADEVKHRAREAFATYVETLGARAVVPSSFGWHVATDAADPADFSWADRSVFPYTPAEAAADTRRAGVRVVTGSAGHTITVARGEVDAGQPVDLDEMFEPLTLDPSVPVTPFDPERERYGRQRQHPADLVDRLLGHLVGTDVWYRAAETGNTHYLEVDGAEGRKAFALDAAAGRAVSVSPGQADLFRGYTRIAADTLQSLLDAELLYGSSFGLWVSTGTLLSAAFHHPTFYVDHVERWLLQNTRSLITEAAHE